jgi:signal recognition particle subunit SRP54
MPKITPEQQELAEREMKLFEVIINSMTPEERSNPAILRNSRKVRIAKGSGTSNQEINKVIKKYEQMKQMMKQMKGYKKGGPMPPGFPGMGR